MTRRAIQVTEVTRRLFVECDNPNTLIDLPPIDWFVRGPRGGVYEATGERERLFDEWSSPYFDRNVVAIIDRSEGIRYLRPGTARHRQAVEALVE